MGIVYVTDANEICLENTVDKCTLGQRGTSHKAFWTESTYVCIDLQQVHIIMCGKIFANYYVYSTSLL